MAPSRYKAPTTSDPYYEPAAQIECLKQFRELCHKLGIPTANTRLNRYESYLEATASGDKDGFRHFQPTNSYPFRRQRELWLYVLREIHELMWILRGINASRPIGLRAALTSLVSGSDFAALDKDTRSRNAQFELRISSYFCLKGYKVDLSTDTDIVAVREKYRYFVECKRIASKKKLRRRIKAARKQLYRRMDRGKRTFGIVATDVTKVAYPHNGLTFGATSEHSRDVIRKDLGRISSMLNTDLFKPRLLLVWLQVHIANQVLYPNQTSSRFTSIYTLNPKQTFRARRSFNNLRGVLEAGRDHDPLLQPGKPIKFREKVLLPKGTLWGWHDDLFDSYLSRVALPKLPLDETVLWLKVEDEEHHFTYADFRNMTSFVNSSSRDNLPKDRVAAQYVVACWLYGYRFPFVVDTE